MMFRFMMFLVGRTYAEEVRESKWKDMNGYWKDGGRKLKREWKENESKMKRWWRESERNMREKWKNNERNSCRSRCLRTEVWVLMHFDVVLEEHPYGIQYFKSFSRFCVGLVPPQSSEEKVKAACLVIRFIWYLHWCGESSASQYDLIVFRKV